MALAVVVGVGASIVPMALLAPEALADFQVNEVTTGDQRRPDVASDSAGNFVVVWASDDPAPGYDPEIFVRRYDRDGVAFGTAVQVSSSARDFERDPKVDIGDDGGFMVVWSGFSDGEFTGIFGRRFAPDATAAGTEFTVNTFTSSSQSVPNIAALGNERFVVVWTSFGDHDGSSGAVFAQRYDDSGAAGTEFQVNTYTTGSQHEPKVARINAAGDFVVAWEDADSYRNQIRLFSSVGVALSGEQTVLENSQPIELSGFDDGFVLVWGTNSVEGQCYDSNALPIGPQFTVAADPNARRHAVDPPTVAAQNDGAFLVSWSETEPMSRRYDSCGVPATGAFEVNTYTTGFQGRPFAAPLGESDFVVVWHSFDQDGEGYGVFGRRIQAGALACPVRPLAAGGCREAGASQLVIRNGIAEHRKLLKLRWLDGDATNIGALGDPVNTTPYAACIYEDESLVHEMAAPAASLCGSRACWIDLGSSGFVYRDRHHDAEATQGGTERLTLRTGAAGDARMFLKGRGAGMSSDNLLPADPSLPVIVQVMSSTGECWGAAFDPVSFKANEARRFRARN